MNKNHSLILLLVLVLLISVNADDDVLKSDKENLSLKITVTNKIDLPLDNELTVTFVSADTFEEIGTIILPVSFEANETKIVEILISEDLKQKLAANKNYRIDAKMNVSNNPPELDTRNNSLSKWLNIFTTTNFSINDANPIIVVPAILGIIFTILYSKK